MSLIKPDVYGDLLVQNFKGNVKVLNLAMDAGEVPNWSTTGENIVFPSWVLTSEDTTDMTTTGTEVEAEQLGQTSISAPVKFESKALAIYDIDDKTALGDAISEANRQHALVFARKLDGDLIDEIKTTDHVSACAQKLSITEQELQNAMIEAFGDQMNVDSMAGIIINSRLIPSFYDTAFIKSFTDANNTTSTSANGIVKSNTLGYWRGIPVFVSDKGTFNSVNNECETLILKKKSLAYKLKRTFKVEEERMAKKQRTDVVASMMYAVKLTNQDGAVVIKKTII